MNLWKVKSKVILLSSFSRFFNFSNPRIKPIFSWWYLWQLLASNIIWWRALDDNIIKAKISHQLQNNIHIRSYIYAYINVSSLSDWMLGFTNFEIAFYPTAVICFVLSILVFILWTEDHGHESVLFREMSIECIFTRFYETAKICLAKEMISVVHLKKRISLKTKSLKYISQNNWKFFIRSIYVQLSIILPLDIIERRFVLF